MDTTRTIKKMGLTSSFVGNLENLNERHKYSIRHIALFRYPYLNNPILEQIISLFT